MYGTTAQFGGASGEVFSAICGMQIPRFTASKPSEFAFASDEKSIRRPTTSFVRRCLKNSGGWMRAFCAAGRRSFSEDVLREKRFRIPSARRGACFRVQSAHCETDGSAFREQTVLSARTGRFHVK